MNKRFTFLLLLAFLVSGLAVAQPVANFTINTPSGCPPLSVSFTNTSTGTYQVLQWNTGQSIILDTIGNGTTNISDLYPTSGQFTISLTVTDTLTGLSNTHTVTNGVTVFTPPTADINFTPTGTGCLPYTVQFTDNSTLGSTGICQWRWTLQGSPLGTYFTQNPTITYTSGAGAPFDVALRVTDCNGCQSFTSLNNVINVYAPPIAAFSPTGSTTSCSTPLSVSFSNTSTFAAQSAPNISYNWTFGDGGTSTAATPTHNYTTCGVFDVRLVVSDVAGNGCTDTLTMPALVQIQNLTTSITSSATNICAGNTANFTSNTSACIGTPTYAWNFGDGGTATTANPSHDYNTPGTYTVTLTVSANGCTATATFGPINVSAGTIADFTSATTASCTSPFTANFTNLTTNLPTITYAWDFGDPTSGASNTSTIRNPSHTYNTCGAFTVGLTITDTQNSCTDTQIFTNYIQVQSATASLTPQATQVCANGSLVFTNNSTGCGGTPTYSWTFSNGQTSTSTTATILFPTAGTVTGTLVATMPNGCTASAAVPAITVNPLPVVSFTSNPANACSAPQVVTFTDNTPNAVTRVWDFDTQNAGGNLTTNNATATFTYSTPGTYGVSLQVTDINGCSNTLTQQTGINIQAPVANFSAIRRTGCTPANIRFNDISTYLQPADNIVSHVWNFGDGTGNITSTTDSIRHIFADTGCYNVQLIITTALGCSDTILRNDYICVGTPPVTTFTLDTNQVCINGIVTFTNTTASPYDSLRWVVESPGGIYVDEEIVMHQYEDDTLCYAIVLEAGFHGCMSQALQTDTVCVIPPLANFTSQVICNSSPAYTVQFTDQSGRATIWNWNFGDPTTNLDVSTVRNPSYTYPAPGTYSVLLVVQDGPTGCIDSIRQNVIINNAVAQFDIINVEGCAPFTVNAVNTFPGMTTYAWSASAGVAVVGGQNTVNGTFTYNTGGIYNETYRLIVTEASSGCIDTAFQVRTVTVHDLNPSLTNDFIGCHDLSVNYTSTSTTVLPTDNITSYSWNFGGNGTATGANVTHLYTAPGLYNVTLTVADAVHGCSETVTLPNRISDPQGSFSIAGSNGCVNNPINLPAVITGATTIGWTTTNGLFNCNSCNSNNIRFTTPGTQSATIQLVVSDNTYTSGFCSDTTTLTNTFNISAAVAAYTPTSISGCAPLSVTFNDNSSSILGTITNWQWNLGVANFNDNVYTPRSAIYTIGGSYNTSLTVTNSFGCTATASQVITVDQPVVAFTVSDTTPCINTAVTFTNTSPASAGATYVWGFGDGTPDFSTVSTAAFNHTYTTSGYHTAFLIVTNGSGCADTLNQVIHVPVLTANFNQTNTVATCPPLTVDFTQSATGSVTTYDWSFGDGSLGQGITYSQTYNFPGSYDVSLLVTDSYGCTASLTKPNLVQIGGPSGTISYSPLTGCAPHPVNFVITSPNATQVQLSTRNGTYNLAMPANDTLLFTHTYNVAGNFVPFMILEDAAGCQVSYSGSATITTQSLTNVLVANQVFSCLGDTVTYTATVVSSQAPTLVWSFNGGNVLSSTTTLNPSNQVQAVVYYPNPGNSYSATLTASNSLCSIARTVSNVTIGGIPTASYAAVYPDPCLSHNIQFNNTSSTPLNDPLTYSWTFGDGGTATAQSPLHTYATETATTATYPVALTVTNSFGCSATATSNVTVYPILQPTLTAGSNLCLGQNAVLIATGGYIYSWSPVTGLSPAGGNVSSVTATPTTSTTYVVTYNNGNGCSTTRSATLVVDNVSAAFTSSYPDVCQSQNIQFNNTTTSVLGGTLTYAWDFGDGSTSTLQSPLHSFATETTTTATYSVGLTVTNSFGCTSTITHTVTVYPILQPTLSPNVNLCLGQSATLTAAGGYIYSWSPVAGLSPAGGNVTTVVATPTSSTTYTVTYANGNGCTQTRSVVANVDNVTATYSSSYPDVCQSQNIQFTNTSTSILGNPLTYSWSFGDATTSILQSPLHSYPVELVNSTTYPVSLTVTNSYGCTATATSTETVYPLVIPVVINGDTAICRGTSAVLSVSGALQYAWSPATALSSTTLPTVTASPTATQTYTVSFGNGNGCVLTRDITVTVNFITPHITPDTAICIYTTGQLYVSGASTYLWTPNNGTLSCTTCTNPVTNTTVTQTYNVLLTDNIGCTATADVTVTVNPLPVLAMSPDTTICPDGVGQVQVLASGTAPFEYRWDLNDLGLVSYYIANPYANPAQTTTYNVTVYDGNGCTQTDSTTVNVLINPVYTVTVAPDSICPGGSAQISVNPPVGATYLWTPNVFLNNNTISNPVSTPTESTAYNLSMTFPNGCAVSETAIVWVTNLDDLSAGDDFAICLGEVAQLQALGNPADSYLWSPFNLVSDSSIVNPTSQPDTTTTYTVVVTRNGCTITDDVTVRVDTITPLNVVSPVVICQGQSAQLEASGASTYLWTPPVGLSATNIANPMANPTVSTSYLVTGSLGLCEADVDTVDVIVNPVPIISASSSAYNFFPDDYIQLNVQTDLSGYDLNWTPADALTCNTCPNPIATPTATTLYIVTAVNEFGCTAADSLTIRLYNSCSDDAIIVPNGFTPNGDGNNDILYIRGIQNIETFKVYDRWGALLFSSNNIANGWDGTHNGTPAAGGVYIYYVVAPCVIDGSNIIKKGNVTLVR